MKTYKIKREQARAIILAGEKNNLIVGAEALNPFKYLARYEDSMQNLKEASANILYGLYGILLLVYAILSIIRLSLPIQIFIKKLKVDKGESLKNLEKNIKKYEEKAWHSQVFLL